MDISVIKQMFFEANLGNDKHESDLCTMFVFDGVEYPDLLHVTHKYFGEFDDEKAIIDVLESYFARDEFKPFTIPFDRLDWFGKDKDVKVLRPDDKYLSLFLPKLKKQLDQLREDDWDEYKPHVAVSDNIDRIEIPIVGYVLCRGGDIIWSTKGKK